MAYISKYTGKEIDTGIDAANSALPKSGGTMSGPLILHGAPTVENGATTKKYVDDAVHTIASIPGEKGENGVTFTPSVSPDGDLSWTNDGGLENPETVNIKGSKGDSGVAGKDGSAGKDGVSVTHKWNGTTLSITSASGTSSADLKGSKGDTGEPGKTPVKGVDYFDGEPGAAGTSVTVKSVSESTADSGNNVVTFSDGKTVTIRNGSKGSTGSAGAAGKDGVSVTHSWNGTTLNVSSASGTSSANLKGDKGDKGDTGSDGVGIKSVTQTTTSSADGGSNVITVTKTDNTTATFTVKNGSTGATGATGQRGTGLLVVTTTPSAYTTEVNGLTPAYRIALSTVKSQAGVSEVYVGDNIQRSYYHYPVIYVDSSYAYCRERVSIRGATGSAGADGVSCAHAWNGTTLSITSASGTSSADLKGSKGEKGDTGSAGKDGTSVTVQNVSESTADGGSNVVTFSDGKTLTVKNGSKGDPGEKGDPGDSAESVPEYVRVEAETVARIVNQHQSGDSIVFPFLSDAHCGYYTDTANNAVRLAGQLLHQIGKRVPYDFIANGGDMSTGAYNTTRENAYDEIEDYTELTRDAHAGVPAVWVPGNHDDAPYKATADRVSQVEMFALIGRKSRASGAVCPNGCNYGYLDLESRHLRVIYLDTHDRRSWGSVNAGSGEESTYTNVENIGGAQLRWLAEQALDFTAKANPVDWSIVVISHAALTANTTWADPANGTSYAVNTANAAAILGAYQAGKGGSITHNGVTVDYDFSALENRAAVICCVHGHNHKFTSATVSGILSIGCPNVMNGRERVSDDGNTYAKTAGTANGTSFCILTIDRENQMIYADCVGAGYDREFEYSTEVITYTNQLPISTDASGSVYNGKGWKENTYLSSGNEGNREGIYTSGFIPLGWNEYETAVLNCKNVGMQAGQDSHRMCLYKADKSHINTIKTTVTSGGWTWGEDGNISKITVPGSTYKANAAYIRICCSHLGEDSIITVNEEIT